MKDLHIFDGSHESSLYQLSMYFWAVFFCMIFIFHILQHQSEKRTYM